MTQNMPRLSVAALLLAFATLSAPLLTTDAAAKTGELDEDLQRAQQILKQLSVSSLEQGSRDALEAELAGIEAHEYVAPAKLTARRYTSDRRCFPGAGLGSAGIGSAGRHPELWLKCDCVGMTLQRREEGRDDG